MSGFSRGTQVGLVTNTSEAASRFAAGLADAYGERAVCRETGPLGTFDGNVVVVSRRALATDEPTHRHVGLERDSFQVIATVAAELCAAVVDDRVAAPVGRDELLETVETARRVAVYDGVVAELLSLTARRRTLQTGAETGRPAERRTIQRISGRIEELHARIDDTLADVETHYPGLVARSDRRRTAPGKS